MAEKVEVEDRSGQEAIDDAYWDALLQQGELAAEVPPADLGGLWAGIDVVAAPEASGNEGTIVEGERPATEGEDQLEGEWRSVQESFARGEAIEATVTGHNRGGLLVELGEIQAFVPASQLVALDRQMDAGEREAELARMVGNRLRLKIIELDRQRNRLIMSERATTSGWQEAERLLDAIGEGNVLRGQVSNLCDFGAFVDLGGMEGLIHISELSWQRVSHPSEVLKVGDQVEVYVLSIDRRRKRIALSLKRLQPDPWTLVEEKYEVGQLVEGVITNVVDFGAFARIEDGVEGLIHISELAEGSFLHPRNVVQEGDVVTLRIINIDSVRHRLGLSLRQAWGLQQVTRNQ